MDDTLDRVRLDAFVDDVGDLTFAAETVQTYLSTLEPTGVRAHGCARVRRPAHRGPGGAHAQVDQTPCWCNRAGGPVR